MSDGWQLEPNPNLAPKNLMMRGAVKNFVLHLASIDGVSGCILLALGPVQEASPGADAALFKGISAWLSRRISLAHPKLEGNGKHGDRSDR